MPAIGYYSEPIDGVPFDHENGIAANKDGRVAEGIYAVGWVKRGPTGVIATNKPDGELAAHDILCDFPEGKKAGRDAFEKLMREKQARWISYAEWKKIEQIEIANAPDGAPRRKLATVEEMLSVLD